MKNILFTFNSELLKQYDLNYFIKYFYKNIYNTKIINDIVITELLLTDLKWADYIICNNSSFNILSDMFYNLNDLSKKIVVIRTLDCMDIMKVRLNNDIITSPCFKNIYMTACNILYNKNDKIKHHYGNQQNIIFLSKLHELGNVTKMPLFPSIYVKPITKDLLFKKYNLDVNKKTIAIFIAWPKLYISLPGNTGSIYEKYSENILNNEKYLLENNLLEKIYTIVKDKYNLIIKPHPCYGLHLNLKSNIILKKGSPKFVKKSNKNIKFEKMEELNKKYTFINTADTENIKYFIDFGITFSFSTFGFHNYMYNIPLIYVSDKYNSYSNLFNMIFDKYTLNENNSESYKKILYGEMIKIENLVENTEHIIVDFLKKYEDKPLFEGRVNNFFYGSVYDKNIYKIFAEYIENIISK
jgi:hypothetical protein